MPMMPLLGISGYPVSSQESGIRYPVQNDIRIIRYPVSTKISYLVLIIQYLTNTTDTDFYGI